MAHSFAQLGATVHLLGRNPDKVRTCAAEIRAAVPGAEVVEEVCDVSDLDAVREWTADLANRIPALSGLVHNAVVMPRSGCWPRRATRFNSPPVCWAHI